MDSQVPIGMLHLIIIYTLFSIISRDFVRYSCIYSLQRGQNCQRPFFHDILLNVHAVEKIAHILEDCTVKKILR